MSKQAFAGLILVAIGMAMPHGLVAEEPCERFLNALRDAGYYEAAIDYLDKMETSPLAPASFKQRIPFEKADTLIKSTARIRDPKAREARLNQAERLLEQAESAAQSPELKARSQSNRGDLLLRRAAIFITRAQNSRLTASEREKENAQAREYLKKSQEAFGQAKDIYKDLVDNFDSDLRDPESIQRRKSLYGTFTVVRLKLPQILEKLADTLEKQDPNRSATLETAATDFAKLAGDFSSYFAGLQSTFYAARCNWKLGKNDEALLYLQQLFNLSDSARLKSLKTMALALASDCWGAKEPYPFDDVIANLEPYVVRLSRADKRNQLWQRVQLELAKAYHAKSTQLKATNPTDDRIKGMMREASKLIKALARTPGEHRESAKSFLAKWNLSIESSDDTASNTEVGELTTFVKAKQRGTELIEEIEAVNADVSDLRRQSRGGSLDQESATAQLARAEAKLQQLSSQCLSVLELAISLADDKVSPADFNQVRYLQSACHFIRGRHLEASVIGNFMVSRFPNITFSRQAGGIALQSLGSIYDKANPAERTVEQDSLYTLANTLIDRYPGSNEAGKAASRLANLLLSKKNLSDEDIQKVTTLV